MITGRPPHLKTFDYRGFHRYFLTFCTDYRRRLFTTEEAVTLVREQILRAARENQFGIIACCFMPDHLHLLIAAQCESSDCLQFIARAKQYSGYYYAQRYRRRLWQRYGYEHLLRDDELTLVVARYIFENPVRARLVSGVEDYRFSGSCVYTTGELLEAIVRWSG